jgi:hypothetical protein
MTIEVYTFEEYDGSPTGFQTTDISEARKYARDNKLRLIANIYEFSDSELIEDNTEPTTGQLAEKLRPYPHSGKFEGGLVIDEAIYDLAGHCSDASEGDVQEHGHAYELIRAPINLDVADAPDLTPDERAYLLSLEGGAIISEDSQGFVSVAYYDTTEAIDAAWDRIVADLTPDDDESDDSTD